MRVFRVLFRAIAQALALGLPADETVCCRCLARIRITPKGVTAAHFPRHRPPAGWQALRDSLTTTVDTDETPAGTVPEAEVMRRLRRHWCSGSGRAP